MYSTAVPLATPQERGEDEVAWLARLGLIAEAAKSTTPIGLTTLVGQADTPKHEIERELRS